MKLNGLQQESLALLIEQAEGEDLFLDFAGGHIEAAAQAPSGDFDTEIDPEGCIWTWDETLERVPWTPAKAGAS